MNRRILRLLRWPLAAVALYTLLGFVVAPMLVKWELTRILTRELGRAVTLESLAINPYALSVRARGFVINEPSGGETALSFDELFINLSSSSIIRLAPVIDEIRLVKPAVRIVRNADKSYNYTDLINKFSAAPAQPAAPAGGPPRFSLNNIEILDGRIDFDDRPENTRHEITEMHIGIPFVSSLPYATDITVLPAFSAKVDGATVAIKGETKPFKETRETKLHLEFNGLDLTRFADYAPVPLPVRVRQGALDGTFSLSLTTRDNLLDTFALDGATTIRDLRVTDPGGAPLAGFAALESSARFSFTRHGNALEMLVSDGAITLRGLRVEDPARRAPVLEVGEIKVVDARADLGTRRVTIGDIQIDGVGAALVRNADGSLNVEHLLPPPNGAPPPRPSSGASGPPASSMDLQIRRISLTGGRADFKDDAVKPPAMLHVKNLSVEITDLSTTSAGKVAIRASLGGGGAGAPLEVAGRLNPIAVDFLLDLHTTLQNLELPPLSPYAVAFAGYGIDKGKLSLQLNYLIQGRKLTATNHVNLDQLTFGDKIDSPTATKLPVRLAVALLRDRHGVIDLDLPISGSLDDPKFKIGPVIMQVLVNIITKAATSPFALIGSAFGGGDELAFVDFQPGRATLTPDAVAKLRTLAKALDDHPALRMEIAGRTNPATDRDGLKHAVVERKVKFQMYQELSRQGHAPGSLDDITIPPADYPRYLTAAYKAEPFKKERNFIGMVKALPVPEMEKLMLDNVPAGDNELLVLASDRADAVKSWLEEQGHLAPERLFLTAPKNAAVARAEFTLK